VWLGQLPASRCSPNAEIHHRDEELETEHDKYQELEERLKDAETKLGDIPNLKQTIQTLETSACWSVIIAIIV
jgi:hypothetical protein